MIPWKEWEQSLRGRVEDNADLQQRLQRKMSAPQPRTRYLRYLVTVPVAFAVVVLVLQQSPQSDEGGFIARALAEFSEQRREELAENQVRHVLMTWSDGAQFMGSQEIWQRGDGSTLLRDRSFDGVVQATLIRDGVVYMSPEQASEMLDEQRLQDQYRQEMAEYDTLNIELPPNAMGGLGVAGNYFCAAVEYRSDMPESQAFDIAVQRIEQALGLDRHGVIPDTQRALEILASVEGVEDLGVVQDPEFGVLHRLRISTPTRRQHGEGNDGIDFDFLADPADTRLVRMRDWSFDPDVVNEATYMRTYVTDEIVDAAILGEDFFDPQQYGYVAYVDMNPFDVADTRPAFQVPASGCYVFDPETQTFSTVPESAYDTLPEGLTRVLE